MKNYTEFMKNDSFFDEKGVHFDAKSAPFLDPFLEALFEHLFESTEIINPDNEGFWIF